MTLNRNLMLALTVTGGAAVAAILAIQKHTQRLEKIQHKNDLQRWDDDTGGASSPPTPKMPS